MTKEYYSAGMITEIFTDCLQIKKYNYKDQTFSEKVFTLYTKQPKDLFFSGMFIVFSYIHFDKGSCSGEATNIMTKGNLFKKDENQFIFFGEVYLDEEGQDFSNPLFATVRLKNMDCIPDAIHSVNPEIKNEYSYQLRISLNKYQCAFDLADFSNQLIIGLIEKKKKKYTYDLLKYISLNLQKESRKRLSQKAFDEGFSFVFAEEQKEIEDIFKHSEQIIH